jgi:hypothetical protein
MDEASHDAPQTGPSESGPSETSPSETRRFCAAVRGLSGPDLEKVALALDSDALCDEVDWWRATIAIDRVVRHGSRTRQAARAAQDAQRAVEDAAIRAGIALPDRDMTRVARAAADVARGLAAGPPARPVVGLLLEYWAPVFNAGAFTPGVAASGVYTAGSLTSP